MKTNREGYLISETHRQCTNCLEIFCKTSKTVTLCPVCNSGRVKTQSAVMKMYRRAKARAKNSEREFTITPSDIIIPRVCPVMNTVLVVSSGKSGAFRDSPSLDRIDSTRGYTPDNIQVISQLANAMKSSATLEELKKFSDWILKL